MLASGYYVLSLLHSLDASTCIDMLDSSGATSTKAEGRNGQVLPVYLSLSNAPSCNLILLTSERGDQARLLLAKLHVSSCARWALPQLPTLVMCLPLQPTGLRAVLDLLTMWVPSRHVSVAICAPFFVVDL